MSGTIRVDYAPHRATVWLDNTARRNAITRAMWIELARVFRDLSQDGQLRCIVLRGAGTEAFGSGADISEFSQVRADLAQARSFAEQTHAAFHAVRDCPVPTVAAIRGVSD